MKDKVQNIDISGFEINRIPVFKRPAQITEKVSFCFRDVAKHFKMSCSDFLEELEALGIAGYYNVGARSGEPRIVFSADFVEKGYGFMMINSSRGVSINKETGEEKAYRKMYSQGRFTQAGVDILETYVFQTA